jgi:hypothetical protein
MRYTEDYRRLVGISGQKAGQGRLIGGLEGYQGRNLIGGLDEGVLDQLALGFGGFGSLGDVYYIMTVLPSGNYSNIKNDWEDTDEGAKKQMEALRSGVESGKPVLLYKYQTVGPTGPDYAGGRILVAQTTGTKGGPMFESYDFVFINASGGIEKTVTETFMNDAAAKARFPVMLNAAPTNGRLQLKKGGQVLMDQASARVAAAYQIYRDSTPMGSQMTVAEDVAYANWLSILPNIYQDETLKLVKVSTGEVVTSAKGKRVRPVEVQWSVRTYGPDGKERTKNSAGGVTDESALTQQVNTWLDKLAATAYTNETVIARKADGTELGRRTGQLTPPPVILPTVTYWIYKKTPAKVGAQHAQTIQTTTLEEAKAKTQEYASTLPTDNEAVLYDLDMKELARYPGGQKGPTPPIIPEPEITPEPSIELPEMTDIGASMTVGFEKFKSWATEQAVPPIPNGVWLGVGAAIIIGVGAAAATMKK